MTSRSRTGGLSKRSSLILLCVGFAMAAAIAILSQTALSLLSGVGAMVVQRLVREIAASEERYRTVTETATDGILSIDQQGRILFVNAAAARIFGYAPHRMIGENVATLVPERLRDDQESSLRRYLAAPEAGHPGSAHRLFGRDRDGREIPLEVTFGESLDSRGRVFTGIVRDTTARLQAEQQIERLAYEDLLTGLPNRALFHDRLRQALAHAHREGERVALLFLDLDDFKIINDSLGHTLGDGVLREVSRRLAGCLRARDTAARLGGDEFIILLPQADDSASVALVAERILDQIAAPIEIQGQTLFVTASIGVSLFPGDGEDPETLLRNADMAMYRAKEHGANAHEFFTPDMNDQLRVRYDLDQALQLALEHREFTLYYQPMWRTADERIVGVEALLRWNHPSRGQLQPGDFIPMAEGSQVMLPLGEWVLSSACEQLRRWLDQGLSVERVSVNLSARQFQQRELPQIVDRVLRETRLSPENVSLEITETAAMKNLDLSIRALRALRARGIRILMDDFGDGHASIGSLRTLPVDVLKIDQHLIDRIDTSPSDAAMVRAIIEMSHGLGLSVVAEGVSRAEQLSLLRRHLCDEFQGHLLSPPLPPEEIARRIVSEVS
jgi:diguanylate cyclase (GGDEF)-like protein/PAS domain S-box-containing protein